MKNERHSKPVDGIPTVATFSRRSFVRLIGAACACAGIPVVGATFPAAKHPPVPSTSGPGSPGAQLSDEETGNTWADPGWM